MLTILKHALHLQMSCLSTLQFSMNTGKTNYFLFLAFCACFFFLFLGSKFPSLAVILLPAKYVICRFKAYT